VLLLFILSILSRESINLDLGPVVATLANPVHQFCLDHIPRSTNHFELYAAIVCGETPGFSLNRWIFQGTGLYHLLVVSGSHLSFFNGLLRPLNKYRLAAVSKYLILGLYTLACGFNPPVARAFIQTIAAPFSRQLRAHWSEPQLCLAVSLFCLCLFPSWVLSLSFWLSWLASMATVWFRHQPLLVKSAGIQIILLPIFFTSGGAHPIVILCNWLLGPVLEFIMLPGSLVTVLLPPLLVVTDFMWNLLIFVLDQLAQLNPPTTDFAIPTTFLIAQTLILQFVWQGVHICHSRKKSLQPHCP
jgi:ComEC/Rec2-related protein